jgi:hypothetical protein
MRVPSAERTDPSATAIGGCSVCPEVIVLMVTRGSGAQSQHGKQMRLPSAPAFIASLP